MDARAIEALQMPATYGRHLVRLFEPAALLAGTGLDAADLESPDSRISVRQALQYIRNTLHLAAEPDWHLGWARSLADHFHGPLSFALLSAPTLGAGLDAFLRYFPSRVPYLHMQGRAEGSDFIAELCPLIDLGECGPLLVETPLVVLQQHLESVYPVDVGAMRVTFDYPPTPYAGYYARHFRCAVDFDCASSGLVIPAAWRELPNLGYIESTWSHALAQCEATMASSRERDTLGMLRAELCRAFEDPARRRPLPTLDEVARTLHVTPRTLIRRLRRLGTSYQAITDEFLRTRAQEMLTNDGITIKEVAAALGFDNAANFGKAFKRWCGVSPGRYRAGHQGGAQATDGGDGS
ncbi:MAG: AraC family transcriptional regulator ligand-binding domain-containing protein [Gammaproteobacteria bacterium]